MHKNSMKEKMIKENRGKIIREKERKKKNKFVQNFLRCSDDRSSVARELKLVYSTRATSRYQERKDSMLHASRGRGFSYLGSFSFKCHKWPCGPDPTTRLSFRP